jgi:hypothetical protein
VKYREPRDCPIHGWTEHDVTVGGRGSDEHAPATYVKCVRCRKDEFEQRKTAKADRVA